MASLSTILTAVGVVTSAVGTIAAGKAQAEAGREQQRALNFEAAQLDMKAKEEKAAAQREALQYRRRTKLALSQLQASGAASGFTTTDPTALNLAGDIGGYGEYQAQMAMYGGESRSRGLMDEATGRRISGAAAARGGRLAAAGTIIGGISDMATRFGSMAKPKVNSGYNYYYG